MGRTRSLVYSDDLEVTSAQTRVVLGALKRPSRANARMPRQRRRGNRAKERELAPSTSISTKRARSWRVAAGMSRPVYFKASPCNTKRGPDTSASSAEALGVLLDVRLGILVDRQHTLDVKRVKCGKLGAELMA